MRFDVDISYPVTLTRQPDGGLLVSFRDVPEALTEGEHVEDALAEAKDCLVAALGGYVNEGRAVPKASPPDPGQSLVSLPSLVAAKLALYRTMHAAGLSCARLATQLGVGESVARRWLDLDHRTHIGHIERALALLGKRLVVDVYDAA